MKLRTRFAPSPTGLLHVGNAYSVLTCQQWAEHHDAELLLRIEDIDHTRCRDEYTPQLIEDLQWLGIEWHGNILKQSEHQTRYRSALEQFEAMEVIYPCLCTRKHIQEEIERMVNEAGEHAGDLIAVPDGSKRSSAVSVDGPAACSIVQETPMPRSLPFAADSLRRASKPL